MGAVKRRHSPASPLSTPVPLRSDHDLTTFDCGEPALNEWLRKRALNNESRFSRTYVLCAGNRVVGFYSIAAGAVERAAAPGKFRRNAPDYVPVIIIGRLAVDLGHRGQGLGVDLLVDALRRISHASGNIGVRAVLVHAKDDAAKWFCMRYAEFIEYPGDSRTLFLPIETIAATFDC